MTSTSRPVSLVALERAPTLASLAYEHVKNGIITGQLPPNSHHSEAALARTLGISRAPLREALRQLREEGLVQAENRGVLVAPLTQRHVAELYEVRLALEGRAAETAAGHVPEDSICTMRAAMERLGPQIERGEVRDFIDLDIPFHDLWIRHSGNALLGQYLDRLRDHIRRASNLASGLREATQQAYVEHIEILDALEGSNPSELRRAVEKHIMGVTSRILAAFPANEGEDGWAKPVTRMRDS